MYPYLRLGSLTLGTYGLTLAAAFIIAWWVLKANLFRHQLPERYAQPIILWLAIAGLAGSKIFHALENPAKLAAQPVNALLSAHGFAWLGGFLTGITTLCILARYYKLPLLVILDIASPAAALGYAIGRLGCLFAGDGDYGIPTSLSWAMRFPEGIVPTIEYVHPTPIYESLASLAIFYYLWRNAKRPQLPGNVLARYLILTGIARFLVEFIRRNPSLILGLTNAQIISLACIVTGLVLFIRFFIPASEQQSCEHFQIE